MPSPAYWTKFATRYAHNRLKFLWWGLTFFFVVPILVSMTAAVLGFEESFPILMPVLPISVAVGFSLWNAFLASIWFDPRDGYLRPEGRFISALPEPLIVVVRWLYAIGLLFLPILVVPFLVYFAVQMSAA